MKFQFSFKNMEKSETLQHYAQAKLEDAVFKFVNKPVSAHITFEHLQQHRFTVKCVFAGGDGFNLQVDHETKDMHEAIDEMIGKLTAQFRKQKEKLKTHKTKEPAKHEHFARPISKNRKSAPDEIDAGDILKYEQARRRKLG
jgi:ribosomal subunit interface protein